MTVASTPALSSLLTRLGLAEENPGAFDGAWIPTHGKRYESLNPATGEVIATVREASTADYEKVAAASVAAFHEWKKWPAPASTCSRGLRGCFAAQSSTAPGGTTSSASPCASIQSHSGDVTSPSS